MTLVEAAIFFPFIVCTIAFVWLLRYMLRSNQVDPMYEVGGLEDVLEVGGLENLDELRWNGWNLVKGWPPVTCWRGCSVLHRDDWWKAYLYGTCWKGCADLHRDDWWKAYVDHAE